MSAAAIVTEGLERRFGAVRAVAGVDLSIARGEIYGFLGPNGAGKSTTVRVLCTLLAPTAGRASVAGHDVATDPDGVRLRIGVALQDAALDDKQSGLELLRRQARLYGLRRGEIAARVAAVRGLIDIGDALDRRIGTYSGGMKRRLDLAAALIHNPEVLFLDEPTTGLDPVSRNRVWEEVRRLNSGLGVTVFLTTQYLEEADALCDRVGIINEGRIATEGRPADLKRAIGDDVIIAEIGGDATAAAAAVRAVRGVERADVHGRQIFVRVASGSAAISPVALALNDAGADVRNLSLREPSLDDVFLEATGARLQNHAEESPDDAERAA